MNNMAEAAMPMAENHYTLYYYPFSLYSLYVRYAIVLRGEPRTPGSVMTIEERLVDLQEEQQLEGDYLLKINPLGQVRGTPLSSTYSRSHVNPGPNPNLSHASQSYNRKSPHYPPHQRIIPTAPPNHSPRDHPLPSQRAPRHPSLFSFLPSSERWRPKYPKPDHCLASRKPRHLRGLPRSFATQTRPVRPSTRIDSPSTRIDSPSTRIDSPSTSLSSNTTSQAGARLYPMHLLPTQSSAPRPKPRPSSATSTRPSQLTAKAGSGSSAMRSGPRRWMRIPYRSLRG